MDPWTAIYMDTEEALKALPEDYDTYALLTRAAFNLDLQQDAASGGIGADVPGRRQRVEAEIRRRAAILWPRAQLTPEVAQQAVNLTRSILRPGGSHHG